MPFHYRPMAAAPGLEPGPRGFGDRHAPSHPAAEEVGNRRSGRFPELCCGGRSRTHMSGSKGRRPTVGRPRKEIGRTPSRRPRVDRCGHSSPRREDVLNLYFQRAWAWRGSNPRPRPLGAGPGGRPRWASPVIRSSENPAQRTQEKTPARLGQGVAGLVTWPRYISAPVPARIAPLSGACRKVLPGYRGSQAAASMRHPLGESRAGRFDCRSNRLMVMSASIALRPKSKKPRAPRGAPVTCWEYSRDPRFVKGPQRQVRWVLSVPHWSRDQPP